MNPTWGIVLHSIPVTAGKGWSTHEQQDFEYVGDEDWRGRLEELGVTVVPWEPPAGTEHLSPVHHADLCRWDVLARGGIVADTDIVWTAPITDEHLRVLDGDALTCDGYTFSIGLVSSRRSSPLFRAAYGLALTCADPRRYQGVGTEVLYRLAFGDDGIDGCGINWPHVKQHDPVWHLPEPVTRIPMSWVHPIHIHRVFSTNGDPAQLPAGTLGIHWYGGSRDGHLASRSWRKPITYDCTLAWACRNVEER